MRILALGPALGVSLLLAADGPLIPESTTGLLQGGALGVLAWVVWYMLAKAFPAHNKALKDQREDFLKYLKESREILQEDYKNFHDSVRNIKQ